ncbi:hypothetical protein [Endothiovibrio diazotrophicus]
MQSPKPIWPERENRRFRLHRRAPAIGVATTPLRRLTPIWSTRQNSRYVAPAVDPQIVLHTTVREYEDHYVMVSNEDWMA